MATDNPSPLFIVGSPRSGTSILVMALRAAGYRGFNEGNFFDKWGRRLKVEEVDLQ